jgi:hypothetical protein
MSIDLFHLGGKETQRWASGLITDYDAKRGFAIVQLEEDQGQTATLFAGAFFSGLPTRLPREGDHVRLQVRSVPDKGLIALVARLCA